MIVWRSIWLTCLSKLINVWSWSFGIYSWYLCHYLTTGGVAIVANFSTTWTSFIRADLIWTCRFFATFIGISSTWGTIIISKIMLLVINNPTLFKTLLQILNPVSIWSKKTILSEHSHFAVCHLFGLFLLLCIKLHLPRIYSWVGIVSIGIWL